MKAIVEYMFSHSYWGLCAWDLPALIVLFVIHRDQMKQREEELEDELAETASEETKNIR